MTPIAVRPLSARDELLGVVRVGMAIVIGVWMYVAATAGTAAGPQARRNLLPYQRLIADRPGDQQRMFRELQEGVLEAESRRDHSAAWPSPAELATDGVPPFARDPTRHVEINWSMTTSGLFVNYMGTPVRPADPAWLVLIQEPQPGIPPDQNVEDQEHHRLADGRMLHVSTWVRIGAGGRRFEVVPQNDGWTQLYGVAPAVAVPSAAN